MTWGLCVLCVSYHLFLLYVYVLHVCYLLHSEQIVNNFRCLNATISDTCSVKC